jgi:hypothetical protein
MKGSVSEVLAVSVELTRDDLRDIDAAASKITCKGLAFPKSWSK